MKSCNSRIKPRFQTLFISDKVAGELSDALTSAFNLSGAGNQRDDGEDGYDFSVNF